MKRIGFILIAIAAIAILAPVCTAQSTQYVNVDGCVYSGALPVDGAKVQIYSWDGKDMGNAPLRTVTTSDGSDGSIVGSFTLKNVPYDPGKVFSYAIKVEKGGREAYALVHIVPPVTSSETPKAEPIIMDLSMESWMTDLTGMVQSGNLLQDALGIQKADVTIYERDQTTGALSSSPVASATTDSSGKFEVRDLPYGLYQAVVKATVNNKNYMEKVNFTVYQQETHINVIMTQIMLATPTPTSKPGGSSGTSSGFFGIPGFEAVLALVAIGGTALLFRRK